MTNPAIKIVGTPSKTRTAASQSAVAGTASLLSAMSAAADLYPHDEIALHNYLRFRHAVAVQAAKRSRWFGGRWFNTLAGEDPDYIPLSGAHLLQTLSVAGLSAPDFIERSGKYLLRLDYAQGAIDALIARISKRNA